MDEDKFIEKLNAAKLPDIRMDKNMDIIKNIIVNPPEQGKTAAPFLRPLSVGLAAFAFVMSTVFVVLEDNNRPDPVNNLGGVWSTYDDSGNGGNSKVWPPASTNCENLFVKSSPGYNNKRYAIRITGTAGTGTGKNYFGVNTFLSERAACPHCVGIDISKFTGIKFKIKGSVPSGELVFIIPHESREVDVSRNICRTLTNYADYECDITGRITADWKTVSINFRKDLKQPANAKPEELAGIEKVLADANAIKWHYRNASGGGRIDIWLDDLELY
jgi:hypothetical protein